MYFRRLGALAADGWAEDPRRNHGIDRLRDPQSNRVECLKIQYIPRHKDSTDDVFPSNHLRLTDELNTSLTPFPSKSVRVLFRKNSPLDSIGTITSAHFNGNVCR